MANQGNDMRRSKAHKAVRTKSAVKPVVRVSSYQVATKKKTAKTQMISDTQFVVSQRRQRTDLVMFEAKKAGLVGGPKNTVIRGRVSTNLVKAAKKRAGVTSDTELLEVALSNLALEDDFGDQLLKLKGSIDPDIDLEF